jgi:Do/DeqQ family serine protease
MLRRCAFVLLSVLISMAPLAAQQTIDPPPQVPSGRAEITLSFAPVVRATAPAVVNIFAKRELPSQRSPFADDPFFSQLFRGLAPTSPRVENSLGSGVILSPDGLLVSNHHVAGNATDIRVVLSDRREFDAEILLGDAEADLVVMRLIGAQDLPYLELTDSDAIEVGDLVLAIGNPFGVGQTVSSGIISGLARSGGDMGRGTGYFIQTDAPINPGNSGGALVDMRGRLVGVNTSILTRSGGSNGIGFAIPANLVRQYLRQAEEGRQSPARPWAGLRVQEVTASLFPALELDRPAGVIITEMHPQSPFRQAGLQRGDVVVSFNGQPVDRPAELLFRMLTAGAGAEATLTYLRPGQPEREARVLLMEAPESPPRDTLRLQVGRLAGLTVINVNPAVEQEYDLPLGSHGVIVAEVEGRARALRLLPGDLLLAVNDQPVSGTEDLRQIMRRGVPVYTVAFERNRQRALLRLRN